MRSHNLVFAALAALTDLGAVAAPVNARGVNDANDNPSLQILSNKIPSNFRFEASALVLPSPEDAEEQASQGGSGVEITRTGGDEDTTVLRTHDVVPLGRGGNNNDRNRTSGLTRPLLAGGGGQASPLGLAAPVAGMASSAGGGAARAGGSAASATSEGSSASAGGLSPLAGGFAAPAGGVMPPWAHAANSADNAEAAAAEAVAAAQQQQEKRAESPLAGVQQLPGQAIKLSNAPVPDEAVKMPTEAIKQAAAALPDNPSPAGAVAATQEMQEMPAQAMAAAGGMIPAAAAAAPQQPKQKRGDTTLRLPAFSVDAPAAETDVLGVHIFNGGKREDKNEPKQRRGSTSVKLPAFHMDSAEVTSNSVGLNIWEKRQQHAKRQGRENTAEGCRRHAAELGPNRNGDSNDKDKNNNDPAVVELRPVAQVEPVASLRPAADIKLPSGAAGEGGLGLMRTLGLQARDAPAGATAATPEPSRKRQIFVNLPRPRPRPSSFIPSIVVSPQVRPAVDLQRRTMRRGARKTAA